MLDASVCPPLGGTRGAYGCLVYRALARYAVHSDGLRDTAVQQVGASAGKIMRKGRKRKSDELRLRNVVQLATVHSGTFIPSH